MDNRDCCHIGCKYLVRKNKNRCGKCLGRLDYRCAICDTSVNNAKRIFCIDCLKAKEWINNQHENYLKCLQCNIQLTGSHRKYCNNTCWYEYSRTGRPIIRNFYGRIKIDRKPKKTCQVCGKVSYRLGRSLCEGKCVTTYHRLSMRKHRSIKDNKGLKLHQIEWY
jgi:hypothetical protein